jgi:hypothetical protein
MLSGFLLEISNYNNNEVAVSFFREEPLPSGIDIRVRNTDYNYASLLAMAQTDGFTASGIIADEERVSLLTIYKNHQPTAYQFSKILDGLDITIDGAGNYISLVFPPESTTLVQLMPRFDSR